MGKFHTFEQFHAWFLRQNKIWQPVLAMRVVLRALPNIANSERSEHSADWEDERLLLWYFRAALALYAAGIRHNNHNRLIEQAYLARFTGEDIGLVSSSSNVVSALLFTFLELRDEGNISKAAKATRELIDRSEILQDLRCLDAGIAPEKLATFPLFKSYARKLVMGL